MLTLLKNKAIFSIIVLIVTIFGLFAIYKSHNNSKPDVLGQKTTKVKIGLAKLASNVYFYSGIENGIFTKYGIDLEIVDTNTTVDIVNALIAKNIDVSGYASLDTGLNALVNDPTAFKILATGYEKSGTDDELASSIIAKPNSQISSFKDLEGKKLAAQPGAFATSVLKSVLIKNSVDVNKVNIVQIGVADQIQALEAGSIDAAFTYEPFVSLSQTKNLKIVQSGIFTKYYNEAPFQAFFISSEFIQDKPEVAQQFRNAVAESIEYVDQNREASLKLLPKYIKIEPKIATKIKIATFEAPNDLNAENIQKYADFSASQGVLKAKVDVKDLIYKPL